MDDLAHRLYAAYVEATGELTTWEQLSDDQQAGWQAVANEVANRASASWPFKHGVGDVVQDKYNVHGTIRSLSLDEHGRTGYWLQCLDSAGRPFDYYVEQGDITNPP